MVQDELGSDEGIGSMISTVRRDTHLVPTLRLLSRIVPPEDKLLSSVEEPDTPDTLVVSSMDIGYWYHTSNIQLKRLVV